MYSLCTQKTKSWTSYTSLFRFWSAGSYILHTIYVFLGYLHLQHLKKSGIFFSHTLLGFQQNTRLKLQWGRRKGVEGRRKQKEEINSPNIFKCILTNDSNEKAAEPAVFKLNLVVQHMKFNPCLCGKKFCPLLCQASDASELFKNGRFYLVMENWLLTIWHIDLFLSAKGTK